MMMNISSTSQNVFVETAKTLRMPSDVPCPNLRDAVEDFEEAYIRRVLHLYRGKRGRAARALGIDRKTLYLKMRKYHLLPSLKASLGN
ncbi:hypothetical protein CSA56_14190 [candidate division KSB3 bacterium]|uniref:DNA binding HTH domain-containing protein n=1 Tax=candidate division KSB3 bacterium TaxID=2044937 RepID=A0A2G6KAR8_9BACT|nr:MAG: hypothetical protein CSA56_14190 [candidate division KSB3 bacterium]